MTPRKTGLKLEYDTDVRAWLARHGYMDVLANINSLIDRWKSEGNSQRRNWWGVLAGTRAGACRVIGGVTFPVLRAARRRKGWPEEVPGAVYRSETELAPAIREQERWRRA